MGEIRYLIDTNVVIDYLGNRLPLAGMDFMHGVMNNMPAISVITKIELLGFNTNPAHYQILENFVQDVTLFELSAGIVESCIMIRKEYKTKVPDAIIAATALENKLELLTRNVADFKNIRTLTVLNPHSL
jgi:predicted nucleic acid-binding protein